MTTLIHLLRHIRDADTTSRGVGAAAPTSKGGCGGASPPRLLMYYTLLLYITLSSEYVDVSVVRSTLSKNIFDCVHHVDVSVVRSTLSNWHI